MKSWMTRRRCGMTVGLMVAMTGCGSVPKPNGTVSGVRSCLSGRFRPPSWKTPSRASDSSSSK